MVHASAAPTVTVVALCYNHARFLRTCLESIRSQTFQDFELLVCDDASADNSVVLIEEWLAQYEGAKAFLRNEKNQGVCITLNRALAQARGKYLAMISTDDMWECDKLEVHLSALAAAGPEVGMVYSDASLMDVDGNALPGAFIARAWGELRPPSGDLYGPLCTRNFIPAMSTLIRVDALRKLGGYDETLAYEDYDMWLRFSRAYKIDYVDAIPARYRLVPGSLGQQLFSARTRAVALSEFRIALKQFNDADLSAEHRALWTARIKSTAYNVYRMGDREAAKCLRITAARIRSARWAVLAMLATFGLPEPRWRAWRGLDDPAAS